MRALAMTEPQLETLLGARPTGAHLFPHRLADLRCASVEAVQDWKGGGGIPGLPSNASHFCLEARRGWCQVRRCSGRCMRTEDEYRYLESRDDAVEGDEAA